MIEGLKFDISADEMKAHLTSRMKHHDERVEFYSKQAAALESGRAEGMNYTGGDPVRALRDKQVEHTRKVSLFDFLREHLVKGEVYRLDESELAKLEFIESKGWY